jgi:hypothetical protein
LTGCQTGTLSHELARKSLTMLAREVLPHVRDQTSAAGAENPSRRSSLAVSRETASDVRSKP